MDYRVVLPGSEEVSVARELFQEYAGALGIDFCLVGFQDEVDQLPDKYGPPSGRLLLVYDGARPVACGALRELSPGVGELKRIYVRPEARRRGLAREISERLIGFARLRGYTAVRLDTMLHLAGAVNLYEQLGFRFIEPYHADSLPGIVYMELKLGLRI